MKARKWYPAEMFSPTNVAGAALDIVAELRRRLAHEIHERRRAEREETNAVNLFHTAMFDLGETESDLSRLRSENEALKDQLRWRTGKPEKDGMYLTYFQNRFIKRQAYRVGYGWDTDTVYIPVIFWLPTPPLPEEVKS